MHTNRLWSALALAVLMGGWGGDRVVRSGSGRAASGSAGRGATRAAASAASAAAGSGAPHGSRAGVSAAVSLPRFALFGWVSPPNDSTTPERIAELAGVELNVMLPAWADSGHLGQNLRRMRLAADRGVRCLAWDDRFYRIYITGEASLALLDTIVADYAAEPGFLGYYFTDEPPPSDFKLLARIYSDLRARDPVHPAWDNLNGFKGFSDRAAWESYTREFIQTVGPAVLCNDHYDFVEGRDREQYVENLVALRAIADEYGLPFWFIVQLVQHGEYRGLDPGELRWQVSQLLAYGARGVGYFTYWTPAPDKTWNWQPAVVGYDGRRSPWYDVLAAFNPRVRAAGELLAGLTWLSAQHAGSLPPGADPFVADDWVGAVEGRAAIGRFAGPAGERYLLVVNSDSLAAHTVRLSLPHARRVWKLGPANEAWSELVTELATEGVRLPLALESGDFALVRLGADPARPPGPVLALGPSPASGVVRFAVSRIGAGARIEIVDAQGRRVWSSAVGPNAAPIAWRGERDGGGRTRPGIYLARVTDASGTTTARFSWLGSR